MSYDRYPRPTRPGNRVGGGRGSFVEEEEELKKKPRAGDDDGRAPVG